MKKIKHGILFYALLSKRFFKKSGFILLLCAVPLLVLCLKNVSGQESDMLKIVLCMEDPEDETVLELAEELTSAESVLQCCLVEGEETAKNMVRDGEADAAWIFQRDFLNKIEDIIGGNAEGEAPVLVIEQEDNVVLQLARIKLFGILYPSLSYTLYQDFAYRDLDVGGIVSEEELKAFYEANAVEKKLFRMVGFDANEAYEAQKQNYLTAPLRGMLTLLILLCGLAADMFFLQDEESGGLDGTPFKDRQKRVYVYQLAAMAPMAVAVLAALFLTGDFTGAGKELLLMTLYLADCMVFCNLVRIIAGSARRLGACIPILMLGMFVLCPVFFTIRKLKLVQYLLPPFYYLNVVYTDLKMNAIIAMLLFAVIGAVGACLPHKE